MRRLGVVAAAAALLHLPAAAAPLPRLAPLPVRNEMVLSAALLQLPARDARGLAPGATTLAATVQSANMIMDESQAGVRLRLDLETETLRLELGRGLGGGYTLRAGLGYRWRVGGVLDRFIATAEHTLGLPTPWSRRHTDRGATEWVVRESGRVVFDASDPASGPTDLEVELARRLTAGCGWRPALALRAGVKLPLAPVREALGSGGPDWGLGGLATWAGERLALHLALSEVWPDRHHGLVGTRLAATRPFASASLTAVAALGRRWEGEFEAAWRQPPYRLHIDSILEASSLQLALGVRRRGRLAPSLALTENLLDKQAPDLSLVAGVAFAW